MKLVRRINNSLRYRIKILLREILIFHYRMVINNKKFCIISNDCWGGEMYKLLGRPFNTPFIGLMFMGPCYIKLLENPRFYLSLPLHFKPKSKYTSMQKLNSGVDFTLSVFGNKDIEINFLNY